MIDVLFHASFLVVITVVIISPLLMLRRRRRRRGIVLTMTTVHLPIILDDCGVVDGMRRWVEVESLR